MSFRMIRRAAVLPLSGLAALSLAVAAEAQSYQALLPLLIDLSQWQGEAPDGTSMQAQGQDMSWASRVYKRGDAEVNVMLGIGHPMAAQADKFQQMGKTKVESGGITMKTGTHRGFPIVTFHNKQDKEGLLFAALSPASAKGSMLIVQYTAVEPSEALTLAERFDWAAMQRATRR